MKLSFVTKFRKKRHENDDVYIKKIAFDTSNIKRGCHMLNMYIIITKLFLVLREQT